ncbi:MAG: hypothetical protein IPK79_08100 [Vampirovibrionales bacterium]|nr:hypothetical protein [Vampirovibrionales bacterium]
MLGPLSQQTVRPRVPLGEGARFGGIASTPALGGVTGAVDRVFGWAQADRTREMLLLDFVGFGLLRTGFDLFRGAFFGQPEAINIPAARERLIREAGSIFTDNIVSGLAAFGLGWWLDRRHNAISNRFMSFGSLEFMRDLIRDHPDVESASRAMARLIAGDQPDKAGAIADWLHPAPKHPAAMGASAEQAAEAIARTLGQREFDVSLNGRAFRLEDLVDDWRALNRHPSVAAAGAAKEWREAAEGLIARTLRNKRFKLGALGKGFALTIALTGFNNWLTRRVDHISYYPGEIGLVKTSTSQNGTSGHLRQGPFAVFAHQRALLQQAEARRSQQSWMPYVSSQWRHGQGTPLALALTPLALAVGLFDTVKRRWINPFKPGFLRTLRDLYDFGKGFPFTTQQQMASMFAALISARLLVSRSDNEYRERLVDSGLGWAFWILGTPVIKRFAAQWLDRRYGSHLLKRVGGPGEKRLELRTRAEIDLLVKPVVSSAVYRRTLQQHIWLGAASNLATLALLGILEPLLAIEWTKSRGASAQP